MSSKFSHRRTRVQHTPKICLSAPPKKKTQPIPPPPPPPPSSYAGELFCPLMSCCGGLQSGGGTVPANLTVAIRGPNNFDIFLTPEAPSVWTGDVIVGSQFGTFFLNCHADTIFWVGFLVWTLPNTPIHNLQWLYPCGRCDPFYLAFGPDTNGQGYTCDVFP